MTLFLNDFFFVLHWIKALISQSKIFIGNYIFLTALHEREDNIDARLELVSVLLLVDKEDEAISVLSPPSDSGLLDFILRS